MSVSRVGELMVPGRKYRRQGEREGDESIRNSTGYLLTWLLVTRSTQGKREYKQGNWFWRWSSHWAFMCCVLPSSCCCGSALPSVIFCINRELISTISPQQSGAEMPGKEICWWKHHCFQIVVSYLESGFSASGFGKLNSFSQTAGFLESREKTYG